MGKTSVRVIGFSGKAGAGKTTLAEMLSDKYLCAELSFADPLRRFYWLALTELGVRDDDIEAAIIDKDRNYPWLNTSCRQFNRDLGDLLRSYQPEVFVEMMMATIANHIPLAEVVVVIDDVRYPNEAEAIKDIGGVIININRREEDLRVTPEHDSENGLPKELIDMQIENNGSLADLEMIGDSIADLYGFDGIEEIMLDSIEETSSVH